MPKQVATQDRVARTVRTPPQITEEVDAIAVSQRMTFNDLVNGYIEDGVRLSGVDPDIRELMFAAALVADRILKARKKVVGGNARLLSIERVARMSITEIAVRMMVPKSELISTELWAGAKALIEELELSGEPWMLISNIHSTSPPLTQADVERFNSALEGELVIADDKRKDRLRMLGAYADHAFHEHLDDWERVKAEAEKDLNEALGVTTAGGGPK